MEVGSVRLGISEALARCIAVLHHDSDLVLTFGSRGRMEDPELYPTLRAHFPRASILGCSTAGEIFGTAVGDDSLVVTAVRFRHTRVVSRRVIVADAADSRAAGRRLAAALPREELVHAFVLSEGVHINGSELVRGLREGLPDSVSLTGGLSGDGPSFERTVVMGDAPAEPHTVAVAGLYGTHLQVGSASLGGWDPFGPERLITRATANELYELDGQPALELYKRYLGPHSAGLPATGLLYPLSLRDPAEPGGLVRTILGVNEARGSMTFAGDMPVGTYARLMRANFDRLIDGSMVAASRSVGVLDTPPQFAVLISCVGRKLVLKQRIEEEVEAVRDVLGTEPVLCGFYSYGEISPFTPGADCSLHNQTMTITTFAES